MNATVKSEVISGFERIRRRLANRPARPATGQRPRQRVAPSAPEKEIIREVARTTAAFRDSEAGRALFTPGQTPDLDRLRAALDVLLAGPAFAGARQLAAQKSEVDISKLAFTPKAVSIGFAVQADLVFGFYGSIGYAADLEDPSGTSVIYLCGAGQEGLIEGADVAIQIGLWKDSTSDMGGYYNGQDLDLEDFAGVAGFALEKDDSVAAYIIDLAVGEDDGVAEIEFYVLTFDINHMPVAQADADHFLLLTELQCLKMAATAGHDEVYFTFTPDGGTTYRYPTWNYYAMSEDSSDADHLWHCGRSVKLNSSVAVKVYDGNENLANFTFNYSDFSGPNSSKTKTSDITSGLLNEIKYELTAQLFY